MTEHLVRASESDQSTSAGAGASDPLKRGDIYSWAMHQAELLRAGHFDQVDILNVADEIEDVGKSDYRALESRLEILLLHVLKWQHQPQRRSRSWSNSIFEQRLQIEKILRQSPSLRSRLERAIEDAYVDARRIAARQIGLPLSAFAVGCPYTSTDLMEATYEIDEI